MQLSYFLSSFRIQGPNHHLRNRKELEIKLFAVGLAITDDEDRFLKKFWNDFFLIVGTFHKKFLIEGIDFWSTNHFFWGKLQSLYHQCFLKLVALCFHLFTVRLKSGKNYNFREATLLLKSMFFCNFYGTKQHRRGLRNEKKISKKKISF